MIMRKSATANIHVSDPILGELKPYDGDFNTWAGYLDLPCFTKPLEFWLDFRRSSDYWNDDYKTPDFHVTEAQKQFVEDFINNCANHKRRILNIIAEELLNEDKYGKGYFGDEALHNKVKIKAQEGGNALEKLMEAPHLYLKPDVEGKVAYGFGYWLPEWDCEHGFGVRFNGDQLVESGFMETVQECD